MSHLARTLMPWAAPGANPLQSAPAMRWWQAICLLSVMPITAALHNIIFYKQTCILNCFGHDYTPAVIVKWLSNDPSLLIAVLIMGAAYGLGLAFGAVRALVAPGFVCSILYSLWIWDIPFTDRIICHTVHDSRILIAGILPLSSKLLLLSSLGFYVLMLPIVMPRFKFFDLPGVAPAPAPSLSLLAPVPSKST